MEERSQKGREKPQEGKDNTIYFSSLHELYGGLRLARRYVNKERLEFLFQAVGGVIVLDENAEVGSCFPHWHG